MSFLTADPQAPISTLNARTLRRDWKSDPGRAAKVLEEYDYILADPWRFGLSEEARADVVRRREQVEQVMEELGGRE